MSGGFRLLWILVCLSLMAAVALAGDGSPPTTPSPPARPRSRVDAVEETVQGHKIADPYRWLEDANSPDTQEYVRAGIGLHARYSRSAAGTRRSSING